MNLNSLIRSGFAVLMMLAAGTAVSQPVLTPQNISLGGGGAAYVTGYDANFINPANLMIRERTTEFTLGIGQIGAHFIPVMAADNIYTQLNRYGDFFNAYQSGSFNLTSGQRQTILDQNYPNGRILSEHQHRLDMVLGGVHWQRANQSFSFIARVRNSTRVEVGRGWYDTNFIERGGSSEFIRDMSLVQQSQYLYEFSFGFAQTFDFVSGLIPRVGKLYIGIAPKFIVGGSYMNLNYDARYWFTEETDQPQLIRSLNYQSTGNFSRATTLYNNTGDASNAISRGFPSSLTESYTEYFKPDGYGGGFDFGLLYVLSFGDDLSLVQQSEDQVLNKSLRLGFSVTDLGFVAYNKNPLSLIQKKDSAQTQLEGASESRFEGVPGQYIPFLDKANPSLNPLRYNQLNFEVNEKESGFTAILPTSFNAGMLLQLNRLKLAADLSLGLNDSAFNNTKLIGHFGIEFAPIKPVPIRLGTRIASGQPLLWGAGTGIEMRHWELTIGTQFLSRGNSSGLEFSGAAVSGLKFHF